MFDIETVLANERSTIETILKTANAPGLSIGLVQAGRSVDAHFGYRDVEKQIPADSHTLYNLNSLTKAFTATACSFLVRDGQLKWDTLVSTVFPELLGSFAATYTVADLLSHRTGFKVPDDFWLKNNNISLIPKTDVLHVFRQYSQGPDVPGRFRTKLIYNNWNYMVLGLLIEQVSGQPLNDYFSARIFKPLGMSRTTTAALDPDHNAARSYGALADGSYCEIPCVQSLDSGTVAEAAGGLKSCTADLIRFYSAFLQGLSGGPLDTRELVRPHALLDCELREVSYAFGWIRTQLPGRLTHRGWNCALLDVEDRPVVQGSQLVLSHPGAQIGSSTAVVLLPESDVAIFGLQNSASNCDCADLVTQHLLQTLLAARHLHDYVKVAAKASARLEGLVDEIDKTLEAGRTSCPASLGLDAYVGRYRDRLTGKSVIGIRPGLAIAFHDRDDQVHALRHHAGDTFSWAMTHDEAIRAGTYLVGAPPEGFLITFDVRDGRVHSLGWPMFIEAGQVPPPTIYDRIA